MLGPELVLIRKQVQHPRQTRRVLWQEPQQHGKDIHDPNTAHELNALVRIRLDVGWACQDIPCAISYWPQESRMVRWAEVAGALLQQLWCHCLINTIVLIASRCAADHR